MIQYFLSVTRARKIQIDQLGMDGNPCVLIARNMALERFALENIGKVPARRHSRGPSILQAVPPNDVPAAVRRARALSQPNNANSRSNASPTPSPIPEIGSPNCHSNASPIQENGSPNSHPDASTTQTTQASARATRPIPALIPIQQIGSPSFRSNASPIPTSKASGLSQTNHQYPSTTIHRHQNDFAP